MPSLIDTPVTTASPAPIAGRSKWAGVWRLDTGKWDGEWRRFRQLGTRFGTRAELVHWAKERDAATRWIFDEETNDFVPLD